MTSEHPITGWFTDESFAQAARGLGVRTRSLVVRADCLIALGARSPLPGDSRVLACERVARELVAEHANLQRIVWTFFRAFGAAHQGTIWQLVAASPDRRDAELLPALTRAEAALRAAVAEPSVVQVAQIASGIERLGEDAEPPPGWKQQVLAAIDQHQPRRSWWRRLLRGRR